VSVPVQQVAYYATGADVQHVLVNGEHVLDDRRVSRVNESAVLEEAAAELERLMGIPELRLRELTTLPPSMWGRARV
jgi:hypothetical protein